jgi:hypothetical protein
MSRSDSICAIRPARGLAVIPPSLRQQGMNAGRSGRSGLLFSYVDLEARVRKDHPLRTIRQLVNEALEAFAKEFSALYFPIGRSSIPLEKLLRAMLLQAFYSIRSERQLKERLEFDLLFRIRGYGIDDAAWITRCFRRTATVCWKATSPRSSRTPFWRSRG